MGAKPKIKYEYKGKLMSITELVEFSAVNEWTFRNRLRNGWDIHDALNLPAINNRQRSKEGKLKEKTMRHNHATSATKESAAKAQRNKKMEDLIEGRLLKKELEDF